MDFEKKYPITQQPSQFVVAQWTKGYKAVDIYFNKQLLGSVQGSAKLKKGTQLTDTELGTIGLKLSESPIMLDVIIDGYHSPVNVSHPSKELKGTSTFFWIISSLAFIAGALEIGALSEWELGAEVVFLLNLGIFTTYIVSAVLISKGKIWAYYLGFSVFAFSTILGFLLLSSGILFGWLWYLFEFFRIAALGVLIFNLKTANAARRHAKYGLGSVDGIIDDRLF